MTESEGVKTDIPAILTITPGATPTLLSTTCVGHGGQAAEGSLCPSSEVNQCKEVYF